MFCLTPWKQASVSVCTFLNQSTLLLHGKTKLFYLSQNIEALLTLTTINPSPFLLWFQKFLKLLSPANWCCPSGMRICSVPINTDFACISLRSITMEKLTWSRWISPRPSIEMGTKVCGQNCLRSGPLPFSHRKCHISSVSKPFPSD